MTAAEIVAEMKPLAKESYKRILLNHGIREPVLGVSVEEMKKIQKRIKRDYQLALDLYATGIYDAMYLAGLIADDAKMTKKDLERWVDHSHGHSLSGSTVAWVAAESKHGRELALEWIDSKKETVAIAGWSTLASLVRIKDDADLDLAEIRKLLERVAKTIQAQPNRVREAMNNFMIAVGTHVAPLSREAIKTAEKIGKVPVDVGNTDCKIPYAPDYIRKAEARGAIGKKRKTAKC
jgi:3-methyladenine DNA glycosylase AlkD